MRRFPAPALLIVGLWMLGLTTGGLAASEPTGSLIEEFTARVPDGWEVVASPGAKVAVRNGLLTFNSPADHQAVIRRQISSDNISITGRIHDAASVYLIWDDENFVGVGKVSPTPFARFQSVERQNSKSTVVDHTGCNGPAAHLIRIQLGVDCIRFQISKGDGEPAWRTLRTIARDPEFPGPPKFVAAGKNFGVEEDSAMLVHTDSVGRGVIGRLARIEIASTPDDDLTMNSDERRWLTTPKLDPVAELLKDSDRDPTFEEVARFYPEMKNKRELVGVPGQRNDIGTDWLGRIDASPWEGPIAWFEIGDEALSFADKPQQISRRLRD